VAFVLSRTAGSVSIRKRGKRSYQVRVAPFVQTVPTREAAEKLELEFMLRRSGGDVEKVAPTTLGQEIDGFLSRLRASGGLRPRSVEFYEHKAKVWKPLRSLRVSALRRAQVEDFINARAATYPRSALDELQFLKRVLRDAKGRGQRIDEAVLELRPVKHSPRRGKALKVGELYELASWFPEYVSRLVLLAGQVGARQSFWFNLTDDMLDLNAGTMPIPAELSKNKREHRVYLTSTEIALFREQLMARPGGTALVFPNPRGEKWDRSRFREQVWTKSIEAAARQARDASGREATVYDGFTFHMLRHTAGSLMALAGLDPAVACERLGHTDGGALFLKTYRHLYEGEKRVQAARLDALVRSSLDTAWTQSDEDSVIPLNKAAGEDGRNYAVRKPRRTGRVWGGRVRGRVTL
jgi:integrase